MKYLFLCALCLLLAAVFIYFEHDKKYVYAVAFKGAASMVFVIVGLLSANLTESSLAGKIVLGLALGCVADVLLNLRFVFPKYGQLIFLGGILVFLGGHIAYLTAVFPLVRNKAVIIALAVVLTALLMVWIFRQITAKLAFKIFGVIYIGAIVALNCLAFNNILTDPGNFTTMFMVGSLLFLISDIVLILNTFGKESKFSLRIANLSLYYLGQILIALSLQVLK
jgi:uncharacterized membrane protein YhhN